MSFVLSEAERKTIEKLCRKVFNNKPDVEFYEQNKELLFLITDIYTPFCNSENGDYHNLMFEGGIMDQPYLTMRTLDLIKLNYKLFIKEQREIQQEQLAAKAKRSRARR